jgi:Lipase
VASQLNWMNELGRLDFNRVSVIGFSLGAHISGFIGKNTWGRISSILGLDPAGPLFRERNPDGRINAGDGRYVECLHTNGALIGAGIGAHICDADFFPNVSRYYNLLNYFKKAIIFKTKGGESQPGCLTNTCAHLRAVHLYVESIQNNGFHSIRCTSVNQANRENCNSGGGQWFGGEPANLNTGLSGIFHYSTNRNAPFARGPWRS